MVQTFWKDGDLSKIENYELAKKDNFKGWVCHHRLELTLDGQIAHSADELKRFDMYYNRPYFELIFLKRSEHTSLHNFGFPRTKFSFKGHKLSEDSKKKLSDAHKGKKLSDETKDKISASLKGKMVGEKNPMYGKTPSEEHRKKIAESMLGKRHSIETKTKISLAHKNKCKSEISNKILEHYGFYERNLYRREKRFYNKHNKFSWEEK